MAGWVGEEDGVGPRGEFLMEREKESDYNERREREDNINHMSTADV